MIMHLFGPLFFHKLHLRIACALRLFLTLPSHLPRMDPNTSHSQPSSSPPISITSTQDYMMMTLERTLHKIGTQLQLRTEKSTQESAEQLINTVTTGTDRGAQGLVKGNRAPGRTDTQIEQTVPTANGRLQSFILLGIDLYTMYIKNKPMNYSSLEAVSPSGQGGKPWVGFGRKHSRV